MFWGMEDGVDVNYPSSDESGSGERHKERLEVFRREHRSIYKHRIWWLVHNCVSHPLIGVAPIKYFFAFHDWTSKKINGR